MRSLLADDLCVLSTRVSYPLAGGFHFLVDVNTREGRQYRNVAPVSSGTSFPDPIASPTAAPTSWGSLSEAEPEVAAVAAVVVALLMVY